MSRKNFAIIIAMMLNILFSLLIFSIYENDYVFSLAFVFNVFVSFIVLLKNSPDKYVVKLSLIYLFGFSLFIGGRYFSHLFGFNNIYCFNFGYYYCLDSMEKMKSNFLINFSLIFFVLGFLYNKNKLYESKKNIFVNDNILFLIVIASFFCGLLTLYFKLQSVILAISSGYMALYEGQDQAYETPFKLLVDTVFVATLAVIYGLRDKVKKTYFFILVLIFILIQLLGVLTGARASFFIGLIVLIWLVLGDKKINIKKIFILIPIILVLFLTNYIASLSGARETETGSGFYEKIIIDIFYSQGISMMVFNLGILETDYPLLAYLKTILPGIQIFFSFFSDIYQYELSFSQNLTYKLAPAVYYNDMGWGWSLLGDFYAFSFGFVGLFFLYNIFWGRIVYNVSLYSDTNLYYRGLFFCFLVSLFSISRASISYFIFLIAIYTLLYFSLRMVIGKNK